MAGGIVSKEPGGGIRRKKNAAKIVDESKKNFLEDIVAFIYSRLDEAVIPPERLLHPRVFELRNRVERGRTSAREFRKRRAACNHRKRWITSPLAQDFSFDDIGEPNYEECNGDGEENQSDHNHHKPGN